MDDVGSGLLEAAQAGRGGLTFHGRDGRTQLSSPELADRAHRRACWLVRHGVAPRDRVALAGTSTADWAVWAFACWLAGATLVPLQVPLRMSDRPAFTERCAAVLTAARCRLVVVQPELADAMPSEVEVVRWDVDASGADVALPVADPDATAVLQFTSGSTAAPKGVVLSHRSVLAQLDTLALRLGDHRTGQSTLGWVPFFHDMGLFFFLAFPVLHLLEGHVLPTGVFAKDPGRWLDLAGAVRPTILDAPQSAWAAALRSRRADLPALDLSSAEVAWFAAEAVDPEFVDQLLGACPAIGLRTEAVGGTYGLAEATLGVTAAAPGAGIRVESFDRARLAQGEPATGTDQRIVSSGVPFAGVQVKVVTDEGTATTGVGHVRVKTPSPMSGYLDATPLPPDSWLATGDLGFVWDGELFVTGRTKDMVVVLGQNHHPEDLEWAAARVPGVRAGRSVAFANAAGDGFVLLVETQAGASTQDLPRQLSSAVAGAAGIEPTEVLVVPGGTIAKTTSGKLRRSHMRAVYLDGDLPTERSA